MYRRRIWALFSVILLLVLATPAACGGTETVEKVVQQTVVVEKQVTVQQTVVVEKQVTVQQTVVVERIVEKVVTPTATAVPTAAPVVKTDAPAPKTPAGTVTLIVTDISPGPGLNRSQAPEGMQEFGVGENLFSPEGDVYMGPELGTEWSITPDLLTVTVKIRKGVQFHKGWGELTVADVVWSINDANSGTEPESIHGQAGDLQALLGSNPVRAVDDSTIELKLASPNALWSGNVFNTAEQGIAIFSKAAYDKNGADYSRNNIIATGPYEAIEWKQDDRIILAAFDKHWRDKPAVKNIAIREVAELATQVAMLKTGEADAAQMQLKAIPDLLNSGLRTFKLPIGNILATSFTGNLWEKVHIVTGLPLDTSAVYTRTYPWISPPDDEARMERARKVREALSTAIDRDLLNEAIYSGLAEPAYQVGAHPTMPQWQERWRTKYDPQLAEQLLDEAGYKRGANGVRFEVPLYAASYAAALGSNELADAISGMWSKVGVTTPVLKFDYAVYRPTNVTRTSTLVWLGTFDESAINRPFDWPKGVQMTSISRGGASAAIESPYVAERLVKVQATADLTERVKMNTEIIDYWDHWKLIPGVIGVPCNIVYNPKSIRSWATRTNEYCGFNEPEKMVPAR